METEVNTKYRDIRTGVLGTAVDKMIDESPSARSPGTTEVTPMTKLRLDPAHIEGHPEQDPALSTAHDNRWYKDSWLQAADAPWPPEGAASPVAAKPEVQSGSKDA